MVYLLKVKNIEAATILNSCFESNLLLKIQYFPRTLQQEFMIVFQIYISISPIYITNYQL